MPRRHKLDRMRETLTRCVASGNYVTMNWDRLRACDDTVQSALAQGEYRRALATLVGAMGYVLLAVGVILIWRGVTA